VAQTRFVVQHDPGAGSLVVVYQEISGSLIAIGNPIDTSVGGGVLDATGAPTLNDARRRQRNFACKFLGGVYCYVSNAVWKLNRGTGNWASVQINANQDAYIHHSGLYVAPGPSGAPRLFATYDNHAGLKHEAIWSDDGAAWTVVVGPVLGSAWNPTEAFTQYSETMYRGQLFYSHNNRTSDQITSFDPATASFTLYMPWASMGGTATGSTSSDYVNFKDRLFVFTSNTAGGTPPGPWLFELTGGIFTNAVDLADTILPAAAGDASADWRFRSPMAPRQAMSTVVLYEPTVVDALIFIIYFEGTVTLATNRGARAFVYDPDAVVATAEVTATMIPGSWRYPTAPAIAGTDQEIHFEWTVDNTEAPGTRKAQLRFSLAEGGALTIYDFLGTGTVLQSLGTGGNYSDYAWSVSKDGGGERVYQDLANEYDVALDTTAPTPGTAGLQRRFFKLYSDPVELAANKTLKGYFSNDGEGPVTVVQFAAVGKVSGPAAVPTLNGTTIEGLTADNGATEYFFDFPGPAQGVGNGDLHKLGLLMSA